MYIRVIMTTVFTHPECHWSAILLKWMFDTIPEADRTAITIQAPSAQDRVTHVPCIMSDTPCIGFNECKNHLSRFITVENTPESDVREVLSRDVSQYHNALRGDSNLEDSFNNILAERAKAI
jgi:hypothetical protein